MADNACRDACDAAYSARIAKLFGLLTDGLDLSETDEQRDTCRERFRRGLLIARQAREIAIAECRD
jgi:hypothetical protein